MVGLTRHGKGSKIQAMCNEGSRPIAYQLASANPHERRITPTTLDHAGELLPRTIVGDKAYDSDPLCDEFNMRGATLLAPHVRTRRKPPRDQHQIGRHYKQRWLIERFFAWLAAWRRLATRWEPRANSYKQWLCLGISLIYIRD
jgi:transposase